MRQTRLRLLFRGLCLVATTTAMIPSPISTAQNTEAGSAVGAMIKVPAKAQPILPFADIRVGMKGYGMTIFSGTKIEPFAIEVVAVVPTSEAKRGTFWIVCHHDRLDLSGPVQGMSGSPIYLWPEDEESEIGEGGKLAGAFAFGYGGTRECLAGVQPIELMRDVAGRVQKDAPEQAMQRGVSRSQTITALQRISQSAPTNSAARFDSGVLAGALRQLGRTDATQEQALEQSLDAQSIASELNQQGFKPPSSQSIQPLQVPVTVGHNDLAQSLAPFFAGTGLAPIAAQQGPALMGSKPHAGIDPTKVFIEPGSVVCVPFAWGDLDLSGNGTVTDVLPDGTVLAFGHAMDGIGNTAIPMATGYVHFVVPSREISFRQAGAISVQGTVLRDENSAIAATSDLAFASAPAEITINIDGQPERVYHYRVLKHPTMTAPIAAAVIANSLTAVQTLPQYNTVALVVHATYSNGDEIKQRVELAMAQPAAIAEAILPYMTAYLGNPFETVTLDALTASIDVSTQNEVAEVTQVWLDRSTAKPGDTVTVHAKLQPFRGPTFSVEIPFTVPVDTSPDTYELQLADRNGLLQAQIQSRPDILAVLDLKDMMQAIDMLAKPGFRQLHVLMQTRGTHLTMTDRTMTDLPSSRAALFAGAGPNRVTPTTKLITETIDTGYVIVGEAQMTLQVVPATNPNLNENSSRGRR